MIRRSRYDGEYVVEAVPFRRLPSLWGNASQDKQARRDAIGRQGFAIAATRMSLIGGLQQF